ncbi:MAG: ABC transporter substrate-binding protein [Candidatus Omnitrophica bacterium CG23_combo_of_CG06-09_8_20_14_all_40_11]|nr:MAG: ABC transporter substrate-binding protein [Candidatus Omnitrophica bacterium CG23_combo_of_CG06-09_8_20_14_all_40_11]
MKIFQYIILFLLLEALFFSSPSLAEEKTKISFLWWPDPGGGFEEVISDFEKENPDIDVEMIKGPTSTDTRETMYVTSFLAGEATYDMVLMDIIWLPKFAKQGWIIPLDDWFGEEERKEFLPGDIQGSIFEGRIYRIPLQTDAGILYYRKDLLEQKGYSSPRTWDEFVKISKELQSPPSVWGFVFQGKQYEGLVCNFLEILWSFEGDVFDEKGDLVLNSPVSAQALKFMYDLIHTHKITPSGVTTYEEEESRYVFQEGHAVFCRNWPYLWSLAQKEGSTIKGKIGVAPLPYKSEEKPRACLGGWGFGISKFTKNKDACINFLKFITSYEAQKKLHLKSGIVPTRKALFEDKDILDQSPFYAELYQVLLLARPRPVHPDYAQISDILRRYIHKVLLGQISPKVALERAESEIKKIK